MVVACFAMLKAFRFDLATTPQYMHVSSPKTLPAEYKPRHDVSATMAGLVAVHSVDFHDFEVHPTTGALTLTTDDPYRGDGNGSDGFALPESTSKGERHDAPAT